jgi:chromosome segregation ATPase
MGLLDWLRRKSLKQKVREQEEELRRLASQLASTSEWGRLFKTQIQQIQQTITDLAKSQERTDNAVMATLKDLKDALADQNQAILDEIAEINKAMEALKLDPNSLDMIVDSIRANTDAVKSIIAEPLPEPTPEPAPEPAPAPPTPPLPPPPSAPKPKPPVP